MLNFYNKDEKNIKIQNAHIQASYFYKFIIIQSILNQMQIKKESNIKIQQIIQPLNYASMQYPYGYNFYSPCYFPTEQEVIKEAFYYYKSMFQTNCTSEIGVQTSDLPQKPKETLPIIFTKKIQVKNKKIEIINGLNDKTLQNSLKERDQLEDSDRQEKIDQQIIDQNGCFRGQQIKLLKEKMMIMLENENQVQLNKIILQIDNRPNILVEVLQDFAEKIKRFKKSKQELLKIIIRKIQKFHKSKPNTRKNRKNSIYGGFKSMNVNFLKKIFSDQDFVSSFKIKASTFKEDFKQQNIKKLNYFIKQISKMKNQSQVKDALQILNEKNKMPWPHQWSQKLNKTLIQIYWKYIVKDQNFLTDLKRQFRNPK